MIDLHKESCNINQVMKAQDELKELQAENRQLKERLFVVGELAITSFDDSIVGIVDRTLNGFKLGKKRYDEVLVECIKK